MVGGEKCDTEQFNRHVGSECKAEGVYEERNRQRKKQKEKTTA